MFLLYMISHYHLKKKKLIVRKVISIILLLSSLGLEVSILVYYLTIVEDHEGAKYRKYVGQYFLDFHETFSLVFLITWSLSYILCFVGTLKQTA